MYIYNITFVMLPDERERFLKWISEGAIPVLTGGASPAHDIRLQQVVEIGGEKPGPDHGLSIALNAAFDSESAAHEWHDNMLPPAIGEFSRIFGPNAAFFITLLEVLRP